MLKEKKSSNLKWSTHNWSSKGIKMGTEK